LRLQGDKINCALQIDYIKNLRNALSFYFWIDDKITLFVHAVFFPEKPEAEAATSNARTPNSSIVAEYSPKQTMAGGGASPMTNVENAYLALIITNTTDFTRIRTDFNERFERD
jgi:hypothetical protein